MGGGEVTKYDDQGRIERCGVENLRGMSEFDPTVRRKEYGNMDRPNYAPEEYYSDENHWSNLMIFDNIKHGCAESQRPCISSTAWWGRRAAPSAIIVTGLRLSRAGSRSAQALAGSRSALRGQLALVQRCHSDKGRHSFAMGQPTASNNVFLDCEATHPFSSSEPHEQWATGGLYDNVKAPLTARFWKDINIG